MRDWFVRQKGSFLKKLPQAVVTPSDSVAQLIKEQLLKNDIPILGIHFLTPGTLRHHLLKTYHHFESLELRENLQLLMKVASRSLDCNPIAKAAEVEPEQFVRLADLLEMTGWNTDSIKNPHAKALIEKYLEKQDHCELTTAQKITNTLYKESNSCSQFAFSDLLVFGFRSKHWADYKILLAAIRSSENATVGLFTQDSTQLIDQAWLGSWEQEMGPSERIIALSEEKPFAYLSYYFDDNSSERNYTPKDQLPEIYIAEDVLREAEVIVAKITQSLTEQEVLRLGVVFPKQTSLLAREVSRLLEKEEISHHNHLGYLGPCHPSQKLFELWVNWQKTPQLQGFLVFLDELVTRELLAFEHFDSFNRQSRQALQTTLTNELVAIWAYLKNTKSDVCAEAILTQWTLLPEEASFSQYITISQPALKIIGWPEDIEIVQQRAGPLLTNLQDCVKKSDFLCWLSSITKPLGRTSNYFGKNEFSLIHLITEEDALLQNWSHLILTELNQGEWPGEKSQIIFLDEDQIITLNQKSLIQGNQGEGHLTIKSGLSLLLSSRDHYSAGKNNFRTLVGSPSKRLILTTHTKNPTKSQNSPISEFLEKVYWISEGTLLDSQSTQLLYESTQHWIQRYHFKESATSFSFEPILNSFKNRRDPNKPFDEYCFCFKESTKMAFDLPAKAWEDLLTKPERAWFNYILGAKKSELPLGKSLHALTQGTWIHSWLNLNTDYSAKKITPIEWLKSINANADSIFRLVEKTFTQLDRSVPDIWKANWHEARRTAIALCNLLSEITQEFYLFSEYTIPELNKEKTSSLIEISLRGRVDLMAYPKNNLKEKEHPLWIIDFKTGSSGALTQNKLEKGIGLQLALYALAFKINGFNDISLSIVQAQSSFSKQIHLDDVLACKPLLDTINTIYQTGKLGVRESMEKSYGNVFNYPLATLKIPNDLIERKWNLTHPSLLS